MSLNRDLRKAIESGRFENVEDEWLARLENDPGDLEFFTGAARSLAGTGEGDRARTLLELVDDDLQGAERWEERLQLLEAVGHLMGEPTEVIDSIAASLERLYPGNDCFAELADKVGLGRAPGDVKKTWQKVARLRGLLQFELGTPVWMEGKGAGRVAEINLPLESFKIDFRDFGELRVGFHAAPKLLSVLPKGHFLRTKLDNPDSLRELKKSDPGALLGQVLSSYDRAMTAGEIREALVGIVEEKEWTRWWGAARKHPQVVTGGGGRQSYRWAGTSEDALAEIRADFEAAELEDQLEIFRKNQARSEEAAEWMAERLVELGGEAAETEPPLALAVWVALEKAGRLPEEMPWRPEQIVTETDSPVRLVVDIDAKPLRERVLALIAKERDDWPGVYRGVLDQETDPRLLSMLAAALEREHPELLSQFIDEVLGQPRKRSAAFIWLAEGGEGVPSLDERDPLRVLQQVVAAAGDDAFAPQRARLRRMWEEGSSLSAILDRLDESQATAAHQVFERAPVEEYLRVPYLNALEMRFPSLRKQEHNFLYALPSSIAKRRAELTELLEKEIPANRKAIEVAREMGDLRENFEYKSARQRHEFLSAKATSLDRDLQRARPIDLARTDAAEVRIGSRVTLKGDAGERQTLIILGPWESSPEREIYSYDSDLAKSLLGHAPGERVTLAEGELEIEKVEPLSEEPEA